MKKYKALMLDVDGTLSPYSATKLPIMPSEQVINSIKVAQNIVSVGLATSRPLIKVKPIINKIDLNGYSILHNGAQIIDASLQTVWKKPICNEALRQLFQLSLDYKANTYFSNFENNIHLENIDQLLSNSVADYFLDGIESYDIDAIENKLSQIPNIAVHKLSSKWENKYELSVTHAGATKETAIHEVAQLLRITPQEIISVGDGHNDIPLLMACGLKIAMENAVDELKSIADFIAPSVDEDGVITVIKKFIIS